jgi:Domain of unknown function (DUF4382)
MRGSTTLEILRRHAAGCRWLGALALILSLVVAGCAGGSGGAAGGAMAGSNSTASAQACSGCGTAMISLTDASGPFDTYMVNVVSLKLTRSDGTVVETVPVTTQVDFAQLVDLSEIISAAEIPAGRYTQASMTLDYNGATIVVNENGTGVPVAADNILLQSSTSPPTTTPLVPPNSQLTMTLSLSNVPGGGLIVNQGVIANLALDFNLSASNTVGGTAADPTVTVTTPTLTASVVPDATRQIRVRGKLVSVNDTAPASDYVVSVWPFNDMSATMGQVTVNTTTSTTFLINGSSYSGDNSSGVQSGLVALAALPAGTLTLAYGSFDKSTMSFTASMVFAGSSVPGAMHDSVAGTVIARDAAPPTPAGNCTAGNVLTVSNGIVLQPGVGGMGYRRQVTVCVAPVPATPMSGSPTGTTVTEDGQTGSFTIADISVGQRLEVSGTFVSSGSGNALLDATSGSAQLQVTDVAGTVSAITGGTVSMTLQLLGGLPPAAFDFTGTGSSSADDASAAAYTVAVPAALPTAPLASGQPASFSGFVAPFGSAPPDFNALVLVSYAQTNAFLDVRWAQAAGVPLASLTLSSTQLAFSQATLATATQDFAQIGPETLNPASVTAGLTLVPNPSASTLWLAIAHRDSWQTDNFSSFADFANALMADLAASGSVVLQVFADGPYNTSSGVLSADQLVVVLND